MVGAVVGLAGEEELLLLPLLMLLPTLATLLRLPLLRCLPASCPQRPAAPTLCPAAGALASGLASRRAVRRVPTIAS